MSLTLADVSVSVDPEASSKCLISLAVAVVAVKICRGVYVDDTVVAEGSQTDTDWNASEAAHEPVDRHQHASIARPAKTF
jgi:hypothetical protein